MHGYSTVPYSTVLVGQPDVNMSIKVNCLVIFAVCAIMSCILKSNNAPRVHLNAVEAGRVCQMLQDGHTQRDAAAAFGVSQTCVRNIWNRFQDTGNFNWRPGSGRPRGTNARDDQYINFVTRRNPYHSAPRVLREVR